MKDVYELTTPQKAIWLTEQFYKGTNINNVCGVLSIEEKVDLEKLKKAINLFVKNNDSFRIRLIQKNGQMKQYFANYEPFDMTKVIFHSEKDLKKLEKEIALKPFELMDSCLFSFTLFEFSNGYGGFVINTHHLIADSWTNGIVANEVTKIYSELIKGNNSIEEKMISYKDYIVSEQEYKNSVKFQKDKEYWQQIFNDIPDIATIPSVKNNLLASKENSLDANRLLLSIESDMLSLIDTFCKKNKVSLYNFFMAVFSIYIGRISNLDSFVIGTPILNRTNFKEKHISGMFINTIPFKIDLLEDITFDEFVHNIAKNSLSMLKHQKYSYQTILEDLRQTNSSLPKLYNIILSYQVTKMNENDDIVPHKTSWTFNGSITDDIDIHLYEWNENNSLHIAYDYRTDKYEKEDIQNIHFRILHIIHQILNQDNLTLSDIQIVTPEEKDYLLYDFNNTKIDYPKEKTVIDLFEEQVKKTPDKIAVIFEDQSLTYGELNERANSLAYYLKQQGLQNNSMIPIIINRSLEMAIGIIAILKLGGTYLPIDPTYPSKRILYMLEDSNCNTVLSTKNTVLALPKTYQVIMINLENTSIYNKKVSNPHRCLTPDSLIYLIYTSGSTGNPKGVMLTHKNINNFIHGMVKEINFNSDEVMMSVTTISFDIFVLEFWCSLVNGLTLVIANEETQNSSYLLNKICKKYHVTMLQTTPSRFNILLQDINNLDYFKVLNSIMIGGEAVPISLVNKLKKVSNAKLFNMYGPTETAVWSTVKDISKVKEITIGKPIANTTCYILDKNHNLLPPYTPGELYIGGDGVSKGYLNKESLTKEKFILSPFKSKELIYNTNDLAYYTSHGELIHLGRSDSQIKLNGYRVELKDIEENINQYKNITNCVVVPFKTSQSICRLCAYYIAETKIDIKDLKSFLKTILPVYMIPSHYIRVPSFPYTPNGKLDKKALPAPIDNCTQGKETRSMHNEYEQTISDFISNILDTEFIDPDEDFFSLGMDSLSMIQLSTKLSLVYDTNISIQDILANSSIVSLANHLSEIVENHIVSHTISNAEEAEYYDTSSAQQRIYYASNIDDTCLVYNMSGAFILDNKIDFDKLTHCFEVVIQRHESLRTSFELINKKLVQKIHDNVKFKIDILPSNNNMEQLFKNFIKPFNLHEAPLFRVGILPDKDKTILLLDMHHIIGDGASLHIILNELSDLYNSIALKEQTIDYKDYTIWENNRLETNAYDESKQFWVNQFKDDTPVLNLQTNKTRPVVKNLQGENLHIKIDKNLSHKINQISKELSVTPYMFLLSAFYILLSKYSSEEDIVVGTPVINRNLPELNDIVGMFSNTLALRTFVNHNLSFKQLLTNIKKYSTKAFSYQDYPFEELLKNISINKDMSRNPLFDIMFVYQNEGYPNIHFDEISSEYYMADNHISKFDLTLEVIPTQDNFLLNFEYCTKLFDKNFIARLSSNYITILNSISSNYHIIISDIDMISNTEKEMILHDFNHTQKQYEKEKNVVQLFEQQVKINPNHIAIEFNHQSFTYQELNEYANQLAHYLLLNDVTDNNVVGIMLDRSPKIIISILAILKLGAIYLPIDPDLPEDRITYMLENSNTNLLITEDDIKDISFDRKIYFTNESLIEPYSKENLETNISSNAPFAIIYTSGSTGKPKGIQLHHKGIHNMVFNYKEVLNTDICNNFLSISTVSFDMFIVELFVPLLSGKTIILANPEQQKIPTFMSSLIIQKHVDFILTTPSRMELLFINEETKKCLPYPKIIQLGGEVLTKALAENLVCYTNASIYNGYGPSETTACCSSKQINLNEINIGKPFFNTNIYILDTNLHLSPIGIIGEICIAGDGVSYGYINNNTLTQKSFIPNPFGEGVLYKTGDLGLYNEKGELEYIGRNDTQIKTRGLRIELSEIEKQLLTISEVKNCCVLYNKQEAYIIAFMTSPNTLSMKEIKSELAKELPSYMVPKYMIQIDKMPLTSNGKIDKKSLANYEFTPDATTDFVAPQTKLQELFCDIWANLLNKKIGIEDDVFENGADSLLAIKFKVELLSHNINIPYSDLFKYKTIRELSDVSNTIDNHPSVKDTYDFSNINTVLEKNNIKYLEQPEFKNQNNILLLGSNGYVGMHIIHSFIRKDTGNIYCIIRDKNKESARDRFLKVLHFYFDNELDSFIDNRIFIIKGDITKENFSLSDQMYTNIKNNIDIVINAASVVKHYGTVNKFNEINIGATQKAIDFCLNNHKRLIHLSSLSVSGNMSIDGDYFSKDKELKNDISFSENNLYIGQSLDNVYVHSKFEAEKIILENIAKGLEAQVLRLGNITNRFSDGKFQINPEENAFATRIKSFIHLKYLPDYLLNSFLEFTPVDICADAIIQVTQNYVKNYSVLHLYDYNHVYIDEFIQILSQCELNIEVTDSETFKNNIQQILKNNNKKDVISGIINDFSDDKTISYSSNIKIISEFSRAFLLRIGFTWPVINTTYLVKYINYFKKIKFI